MPVNDVAYFIVYFVLLVAAAVPLGIYMKRVFEGERTFAHPVLEPVERVVYRVTGVDPEGDMSWTGYAAALLAFTMACFVVLFALLRLQGFLPLNAGGVPGMTTALAFNTAVSFVTNTNWQAYAGEASASYLTQMLGLTWQNFVSAAVGISVAVAFARGLTRSVCRGIGNFWVDLVRSLLYVLIPISLVLALVLVSQGVIQNVSPFTSVTTLEGASQTIAQGPVASQEAIKELGTNGGGFFNANSAHPYENPSPLTNFLETFAILVIPAGLTMMFGKMAGNMRQGWVLLAAMFVLFAVGLTAIYGLERAGNPNLARAGADISAAADRPGGNMEGKEVRFGQAGTALFENATTAASCGAVTASHDSMTPLAGGMTMLNIALGEVIFGGVGAGLYGMLIFAILSVFIAGLMVGRTPEYLGKKIGPTDMKLAMLAILALEAGILVIAGISAVTPSAVASVLNAGPHGLTEILYAATSAVGNNGSAFGGLSANTTFYNVALGIGMLIGRYLFIVPVLGIAGSMACKKVAPPTSGTFPTDGPLFTGLLIGVIVIVGALTFFPVYALGPIVEQFMMNAGTLF
ncbi:MAG: potassium-transporting ATPase subunit KdpA [Coriobacteriales bacterium]|nr:potassium-transporting ATPase subunit KdpA [Coriobacteriales bacterium]